MDWVRIWEIINQHWEKKSTIIIIILCILFGLPCLFNLIDFSKLQIWQWCVIAFSILLIFIFWVYSTSCPRCSKGKHGIIIAITAEEKDDKNTIDHDFIAMMRHEQSANNNLQIITLPCKFSERIIDNDKAIFFCRKCKANMVIWGSVKKRKINNSENRVLRLSATMVHPPIPQEISVILGKTMSETMPLVLNIDSRNESLTFEVTAKWMNWTVKYFIANVMLFERDITLAERSLLELWNNSAIQGSNIPQVKQLRFLIRFTLIGIYEIKARQAYIDWQKYKIQGYIATIGENLDKMMRLAPLNYGARLLRAIYLFLDGRKVDIAIKEIRSCSGVLNDASWKYSLAFLHAYKGKLDYAQRFYKQAFSGTIEPEQILNIETFILYVIEEEQDKKQLYFCLGLICYQMKMDYQSARRYFDSFLSIDDVEIKYPKQVTEAQRILTEELNQR